MWPAERAADLLDPTRRSSICRRDSGPGPICSSRWRIGRSCWCWTSRRPDSIRSASRDIPWRRSSGPSRTRGRIGPSRRICSTRWSRVADHVTMINNGKILLSSPLEAILATHLCWTPLRRCPVAAGAGGGAACMAPDTNGRRCIMARPANSEDGGVAGAGAQEPTGDTPSLEEIFVARVGTRIPAAVEDCRDQRLARLRLDDVAATSGGDSLPRRLPAVLALSGVFTRFHSG